MSIASLYPSINPSLLLDFANSKVLDSRVTFTRTTTATCYDGVTTAVAEQNLVLQSQFAASWTGLNATLTANTATAPDGTSTAATIVENTANTEHIAFQFTSLISAATYTISCFIKAGARNYGMLRDAGYAIKIDLTNGTTTVIEGSPTSHSATSVGNGWYRCVMTVPTTNNNFQAGPHNNGSATAYTGNGTGSVYVWGFQVEQRSSATAYTATTTQAITNYIPVLQTASAGRARFDHNPTTGESLGLLIEEARTNSLTYSAQFDNAAWTKSNATITANTIVAPDGTLTGDKFVEGSGASQTPQVYGNTSISASTAFTLSIYAKAAERNWLVINANDGTGSYRTWFNLSTGVVGTNPAGTTATITPVGNGWYRCTASRTTQSTVPSTPLQVFQVADADGSITYTGNGFSGLFIWGAQLEISGSFATSYIPTVASTVTRNADAASMTGTNFSSWFNNANMSAYIEAATNAPPASTNTTGFSLNDGTLNRTNFFQSGGGSLSSARAWLFAYNNGATIVSLNSAATAVTQSVMAKSCVAIKTNDFGFSLNSGAVLTDTDGTPVVPTQMNIGADYNASAYLNGTIKKLAYYPIRVTNTQLQSLTV